jgi:hypothetical protein
MALWNLAARDELAVQPASRHVADLLLAACSLSPKLFIGLLPGVARGSRPAPSVELLELLHEIAADPAIAPLLATPAVLAALKPPLLSGHTSLQLACIDVLAMLHDHGHGDAIATEDIGAFLIEMIRRQARMPTSAMASAAAGLPPAPAKTLEAPRQHDEVERAVAVSLARLAVNICYLKPATLQFLEKGIHCKVHSFGDLLCIITIDKSAPLA